MAAPRALGIKINKIGLQVNSLEKRIKALETLLEMELARGHMAAEKASKAPPKRSRTKKAA